MIETLLSQEEKNYLFHHKLARISKDLMTNRNIKKGFEEDAIMVKFDKTLDPYLKKIHIKLINDSIKECDDYRKRLKDEYHNILQEVIKLD